MYDKIIKRLRLKIDRGDPVEVDLLIEAADAIEELSKRSECPCWYGDIRFCSMLGKPIPESPKEDKL